MLILRTKMSSSSSSSNCKPNTIWVDKGSEFDNRSVKPWLEKML